MSDEKRPPVLVICPHWCSHRGSHMGICMTCACPSSTVLGVPGTGPTYPLWQA